MHLRLALTKLDFMFTYYDPLVNTTFKYLELLRVRFNRSTINEDLQSHPNWPSLLCISDTLTKVNVPHGAGTVSLLELDNLPVPFLTQLTEKVTTLTLVTHVDAEKVVLYQGITDTLLTVERNEFLKKWTGLYIIAEPSLKSGELNYKENRRRYAFSYLAPTMLTLLLLIISIFYLQKNITALNNVSPSYRFGLYGEYIIMLAGSIISILLVWYEIDRYNPTLQRVCTSIMKSDCNAVLTSKSAKIFSWLSWSEVGLFYFFGGLLSLILGNSDNILFISWLNIISFPYTVFSVYFQWKIAKQWCALCLAIQAVLVIGSINILTNKLVIPINQFKYSNLLLQIGIYLVVPFIWYSIKPFFNKLQEGSLLRWKLSRIKFNSGVLRTLLSTQKQVSTLPNQLGIVLGNPNAQHTLIEVCSVYCPPCSQIHHHIEKLLEMDNNIKVQIIFQTHNTESNRTVDPTRHLLAIAKNLGTADTHRALNDWHSSEIKDYSSFATRHPLDEKMLEQTPQLLAMNAWCQETGIIQTPTFFLDGYELPDFYEVGDFKYILLDYFPTTEDS